MAVATQMRPQKQKRFSRRWIVLAILLMIPIGLTLFAYVAGRVAGDKRLEQAFSEADRLDPGWRFVDLEAKRLPYPEADKNGIDQVLRVRSAMPPSQWPLWPFPSFEGDPVYLAELRRAMDESLEGDRLAPTLLNAEQERVIRAEVARAADAIELARQMPNYPYGRYPVKWTKDYVSTPLPHVHEPRTVANLMNFDARLRAHNNDVTGACHDVKAILYASRAVGDEPNLISQLVRVAVDTVAVQVLERSLAWGRASEPVLSDLQMELEEEAQTPYFLTGLRGERACLDYLLENVQQGVITFADYRRLMTGMTKWPGTSAPNEYMVELYSLRGYLKVRAERAQVLHHMNEIAELCQAAILGTGGCNRSH